MNATLTFDDGSPVTGIVSTSQADQTGKFSTFQDNQLDATGFASISTGINITPQMITMQFTLLDNSGNPVPGAQITQTFPSAMLSAVPTGQFAVSIVLVKNSNPLIVKSLSLLP